MCGLAHLLPRLPSLPCESAAASFQTPVQRSTRSKIAQRLTLIKTGLWNVWSVGFVVATYYGCKADVESRPAVFLFRLPHTEKAAWKFWCLHTWKNQKSWMRSSAHCWTINRSRRYPTRPTFSCLLIWLCVLHRKGTQMLGSAPEGAVCFDSDCSSTTTWLFSSQISNLNQSFFMACSVLLLLICLFFANQAQWKIFYYAWEGL